MHYKFYIHFTKFIITIILFSFLNQLNFKVNAFYDIIKNKLSVNRNNQL